MDNATVTINYNSFQKIKEKADRYEVLEKEIESSSRLEEEFIDKLCYCIEKANEQKTLAHKQYFIAKGMEAIIEYFGIDFNDLEIDHLDYGEEPKGKVSNGR